MQPARKLTVDTNLPVTIDQQDTPGAPRVQPTDEQVAFEREVFGDDQLPTYADICPNGQEESVEQIINDIITEQGTDSEQLTGDQQQDLPPSYSLTELHDEVFGDDNPDEITQIFDSKYYSDELLRFLSENNLLHNGYEHLEES